MLSSTLFFLKDNQAILSWIGGGIVVVASGLFAIVKLFVKSGGENQSNPDVNADRGSVAAGRDINVNARISPDHSKR
jgi:hypothetical protein